MDEETGGDVTADEQEEVREASRLRPQVVHEVVRREGEDELHRPLSALAWSALAAGMSMGFSLVGQGLLKAYLPAARWSELIIRFGYSLGFLFVILGRQQLFTENTLTVVIPLLSNRDRSTAVRVARLWAVVLVGNLVGAMVFALALSHLQVFAPEVEHAFGGLASDAVRQGAGAALVKGVFAGWLIALMVWMLPSAESGQAFIVVAVTYVVGLGGLTHVVAGSVEAFYSLVTGAIGVQHCFAGYVGPVLLGNLLGGSALVAALNHAQVASGKG